MAANTLPIFPLTPVNWNICIASQVTPRVITTQAPVLLGTAGKNGTLIHTLFIQHLGTNAATVARLYHKDEAEAIFCLIAELTLPGITAATETGGLDTLKFNLPDILPTGNKGLHLAPNASLYMGLGAAITPGIQVWALGGNY